MVATPWGLYQAMDAFRKQESGGNPRAVSVQNARGTLQITAPLFAQYAQEGERFDRSADVEAVAQRAFQAAYERNNGDPARTAVEWFSGAGYVAGEGPTPWKNDRRDANSKSVSSYVSDITRRLSPISTAEAADLKPWEMEWSSAEAPKPWEMAWEGAGEATSGEGPGLDPRAQELLAQEQESGSLPKPIARPDAASIRKPTDLGMAWAKEGGTIPIDPDAASKPSTPDSELPGPLSNEKKALTQPLESETPGGKAIEIGGRALQGLLDAGPVAVGEALQRAGILDRTAANKLTADLQGMVDMGWRNPESLVFSGRGLSTAQTAKGAAKEIADTAGDVAEKAKSIGKGLAERRQTRLAAKAEKEAAKTAEKEAAGPKEPSAKADFIKELGKYVGPMAFDYFTSGMPAATAIRAAQRAWKIYRRAKPSAPKE